MKNYFGTNGKIGRLEYILDLLLMLLGVFLLSILISFIPQSASASSHAMSFFETCLSIFFTVPALSFSSTVGIIVLFSAILVFTFYNNTMVKRLHDMSLSGLWIIIYWTVYCLRLGLQYAVFHGYKYNFIDTHIMVLRIIIFAILAFLFLGVRQSDGRFGVFYRNQPNCKIG